MDNRIPLFLFGLAFFLALLRGFLRKGKGIVAILAELCTAAGVLTGLAAGMDLQALGTPLLAVCAAALMGLVMPERGGSAP